MPGLVPGIHVLAALVTRERRGWPGQARPWRQRAVAPPLQVLHL